MGLLSGYGTPVHYHEEAFLTLCFFVSWTAEKLYNLSLAFHNF